MTEQQTTKTENVDAEATEGSAILEDKKSRVKDGVIAMKRDVRKRTIREWMRRHDTDDGVFKTWVWNGSRDGKVKKASGKSSLLKKTIEEMISDPGDSLVQLSNGKIKLVEDTVTIGSAVRGLAEVIETAPLRWAPTPGLHLKAHGEVTGEVTGEVIAVGINDAGRAWAVLGDAEQVVVDGENGLELTWG